MILLEAHRSKLVLQFLVYSYEGTTKQEGERQNVFPASTIITVTYHEPSLSQSLCNEFYMDLI